jgi:hypothetical protein
MFDCSHVRFDDSMAEEPFHLPVHVSETIPVPGGAILFDGYASPNDSLNTAGREALVSEDAVPSPEFRARRLQAGWPVVSECCVLI